MDSNAIFAVLLLIVGLAILMAEIFIPSGGLLGVITFLSLVVSLIFAYRAWGGSHPGIFYAFCVLLLLLIPIVIGTGFSILPHTAVGKKVILEAPDAETLTPYLAESRHLEQLVGEFGTALTMLNPGGLVRVLGERLHATSAGFAIEPGDSLCPRHGARPHAAARCVARGLREAAGQRRDWQRLHREFGQHLLRQPFARLCGRRRAALALQAR